MSIVQSPVSDLLVTAKTREVQRGMLAEMKKEQDGAVRHFLAAAHLELVLVNDYAQAGQDDLAYRSRVSAASCFWRAGQIEQARSHFNELIQEFPARAGAIQEMIDELGHGAMIGNTRP